MRCWQVADAQEMLFGWRGALAVTLNAAWDPEQVDPDLKSFVKAFDAIYVFQPLSIEVRVQGSEEKFERGIVGMQSLPVRASHCIPLPVHWPILAVFWRAKRKHSQNANASLFGTLRREHLQPSQPLLWTDIAGIANNQCFCAPC